MAGYISFFKLEKWFTETFSLDEQRKMEEKYSVGGMGDTPLFFGKNATAYNGSAAYFLADLTQWFNTKELSSIGLRLAKKAEELFKEQNGKCAVCGENLGDNWSIIHVDHIIPWALVGDELKDNYQVLCETCNESKSANTDYIFKNLIKLI